MALKAFLDESSGLRHTAQQVYLIGAALAPAEATDAIRKELLTLKLPGQTKVHWSDESESRKKKIVDVMSNIDQMSIIVSHLDVRSRKTERYRRKCLETLYYQFAEMHVWSVTLEGRTSKQDEGDKAHIVALQSQGLSRSIRIEHARGGDEPMLWIPDVFLGAVNAAHHGDSRYLEKLEGRILMELRTPASHGEF